MSTNQTIGMLYVVDVRMRNRATKEKVKHKLLVVGCEADDSARKLTWIFDSTQWDELSITSVEKVREKVHYISTTITQDNEVVAPVIDRGTRQETVRQSDAPIEQYDPHLYAVGLTTTMLAKDEMRAIRKVARALLADALQGHRSGPSLSEESTLTVERISMRSGYAMPRDVSSEINDAKIMRG